jgi:hypothetical protein
MASFLTSLSGSMKASSIRAKSSLSTCKRYTVDGATYSVALSSNRLENSQFWTSILLRTSTGGYRSCDIGTSWRYCLRNISRLGCSSDIEDMVQSTCPNNRQSSINYESNSEEAMNSSIEFMDE